MNIPRDTLVQLYRHLLTARRLDEKLYAIYTTGVGSISGFHRGTGEEAIPVAICAHLRPDDYLLVRTRCIPFLFAKGLSLRDVIACEFERDVPKAGGHSTYAYIDPEVGILGRSHTLGEDIPIYTGAALSAKIRKSGQVAVITIGDGGASRGPVHEAMVVAAAWKLPVVFVLQNNQYAMGTSSRREVYQITDFSDRARGYGFPGQAVDGNDMLAVYAVVKEYVERARSGGGPGLIAAETYRLRAHNEGDPQRYRPAGEAEAWWQKDPLPRYQKRLLEMGILTAGDISRLEAEIQVELDEATEAALAIPPVHYDDYIQGAGMVIDVL